MVVTRVKIRIKFDKCVGLSILSGIGLFTGELLSFFALGMEKASVLSPIYGAVIPFGFLLSIFLLGEKPTKKTILGVITVFTGVFLVTI
ncbi:unnamed protein product [marine sediment metagenome]|uniref:EamA domain-containing protein n=1 Tax=marine sediment metagenome TaxID=412755 RepID=X1PT73_9ZZZZ